MSMLPMFEKDKANHFIYGAVIYGLTALVITPVFCLIAVFVIAVAKELFDFYNRNKFSYGDIMATELGAIVAFVITLI